MRDIFTLFLHAIVISTIHTCILSGAASGMFGASLAAKWELLSFDIQEGAVKRILKRLNSMLSCLSKVFASLHAVKEFKDRLEATVEGLREPLEFIPTELFRIVVIKEEFPDRSC